MQIRMRRAVGVAASAALCVPLAACVGGGSGGDADSKTVTIWTSVDQPVLDGLEAQLAPEAKEEGITVKWQKVENINQLIMTKIQANDTPDIALIPQPGVVADIVKRNKAIPLDFLDQDTLKSDMVPGTLEAGTVDGKLYGLLASANVKSLVFYPKKAWDAAGYEAPTSLAELNSLTDQIKSDNDVPPWCMGIGSDAATGWVVTDWIEDLVLRYGGPDEYDKWVKNEVKFDSPVVREAAGEFDDLILSDGNVPGGRKSIASTSFQDADDPMWSDKPGCWLLKQGNFITAFFPEDVLANLDEEVGVFGFPPAEAGGENPILGGGDLATLLTDNDSSKKVMELMAQANFGEQAVKNSSYISPFKTFDTSLYPNEIQKQAAEVLYDATAFRFDGSDQMPGAVGAGTFWKDMTAWVSDDESLDEALKNIDDSWPSN